MGFSAFFSHSFSTFSQKSFSTSCEATLDPNYLLMQLLEISPERQVIPIGPLTMFLRPPWMSGLLPELGIYIVRRAFQNAFSFRPFINDTQKTYVRIQCNFS